MKFYLQDNNGWDLLIMCNKILEQKRKRKQSPDNRKNEENKRDFSFSIMIKCNGSLMPSLCLHSSAS